MEDLSSEIVEILIWIVYGLVSLVSGTIVVFINKKRVRTRMEALDYNAHKENRKRSYTRNLILDEQIVLKIKEDDENFDDIAFKEWAKETFVEFQKAWTEKDMMSISSRLDKSLYEQYRILVDTNIEKDCKNIIEIKNINYIDFSSYSNDNEKEIIEVAINVVLYDYIVNDLTKEIINGSEKVKQRTTYKLTFYRNLETQTDNEKSEIICPNCGGKIDYKQNKCEYCKTWILNGVRDWILNSIEKY